MHALMQYLMLSMEAEASKVSVFYYLIICYNGRIGFVPYTDYIIGVHETNEASDSDLDFTAIRFEG